jgi:hypothetical protein
MELLESAANFTYLLAWTNGQTNFKHFFLPTLTDITLSFRKGNNREQHEKHISTGKNLKKNNSLLKLKRKKENQSLSIK